MSQLYQLRNGGIGHLDDVLKEKTVAMMRFLTIQELIEGAEQLKATGTARFANEGEMLQEAISILQGQDLTPGKLTKALESIADVEYIKRYSSDDESVSSAVKQIIADLSEKAKGRGYQKETEIEDEEDKE